MVFKAVVVTGVREFKTANFHRLCASPMAEQQLTRNCGLEKLGFCSQHIHCFGGLCVLGRATDPYSK